MDSPRDGSRRFEKGVEEPQEGEVEGVLDTPEGPAILKREYWFRIAVHHFVKIACIFLAAFLMAASFGGVLSAEAEERGPVVEKGDDCDEKCPGESEDEDCPDECAYCMCCGHAGHSLLLTCFERSTSLPVLPTDSPEGNALHRARGHTFGVFKPPRTTV